MPGGTLPAIRQDISYVAAGSGTDGTDRWTIYDPIQHRYFRISDDVRRVLSIWTSVPGPHELVEAARHRLGLALDLQTIEQIAAFLEKCNLVDRTGPGSSQNLIDADRELRNRRVQKVLGAAFYLKVPLFNPRRLLRAIAPIFSFVFTRFFWLTLLGAGAAGIYFGSDDLFARFGEYQSRFFSNGLFQILVAIVVLKVAHELGHALTAHRFGCRVTSMGIAFMVFIPLLFTDVSDAWRLADKRQRLLITAAGMLAELGLALAATFAWAFMVDGTLREYVFYIAAVGWITSLLFNLNPLLKFDGYFLLSDWLELENLQTRALAYGRWHFRRRIFGSQQPAPESAPHRTASVFLFYCYLSWAYRLVIFTMISAMLYAMLLKIIAVPLIVLFFYMAILRHLVAELVYFASAARGMSARRLTANVTGIGVILAFIFLPWSSTVRIPAVLQLDETHPIHAPMPAEITAIHKKAGDRVRKGEVVIELTSPSLDLAHTKLQIEIRGIQSRLAGSLVSASERSERLLLRERLQSLNARLAELEAQQSELRYAAGADGILLELANDIAPGVWVNDKKQLALLQFSNRQTVLGVVAEQDHWRLADRSTGLFVPDDPTRDSLPVSLHHLSSEASKRLDIPELASVNAGPVSVEPQEMASGFIARNSYHQVEFRPDNPQRGLNQTATGTVLADGMRQSIASRLWDSIAHVVVREFGA